MSGGGGGGGGINPVMEVQNANIAQVLMEEDLEREIQRNQAATRMAREREEQAALARKRAEESQLKMKDMMSKYELMKAKLEFTKKHLEETNDKISEQEKLTLKITDMKARVEQYNSKKQAVQCLNEAVKLKAIVNGLEVEEEAERELKQQQIAQQQTENLGKKLEDHEARNASIKAQMINHMEKAEERLKKREELKAMLEEQVERGEARAKEQTRLAKAREDLLELKLRELRLQQQRLERKKEQQARAELENQEFIGSIDKELEEMESRKEHKEMKELELANLTAQREKLERARNIKKEIAEAREKTRQLEKALKEKKQKHLEQAEAKALASKEVASSAKAKDKETPTTKADTEKAVTDNVKKEADTNEKVLRSETVQELAQNVDVSHQKETSKKDTTSEDVPKVEPEIIKKDLQKAQENCGAIPKVRHNNGKSNRKGQKVKSPTPRDEKIVSQREKSVKSPSPRESGVKSPCPRDQGVKSPVRGSREGSACSSLVQADDDEVRVDEVLEEEEEVHYDLSDTVKKIEGKCMSVKGDLAEMALSEQYLRTKQAMLMAKKKEKEMGLAEKIAGLRETEAAKLREKVQHMQELLAQRREKLQIQEQLMKEKAVQKQKMDKLIESRRRRGDYCEKELIDRVVFEHPPSNKK